MLCHNIYNTNSVSTFDVSVGQNGVHEINKLSNVAAVTI